VALQSSEKIGIFQSWIELLKQINIFEYYQQKDSTGVSESNLWKLINIIKENKLPKVFKSEVNAIPAQSKDAIRLMTVHASKGLEFDYVFLPYLDGLIRKNHPEDLVVDLDSTMFTLPVEGVHPFWSHNVSNQMNLFLQEENERLLYVAVTRTKKMIYFFLNSEHQKSNSPWVKKINQFIGQKTGLYKVSDKYSFLINYC
jgi:ATP-dependent exoDNAse (exonuclease V) beta subunit